MAAKDKPKFGSAEWRKLHPAKPKAPPVEFVTVDRFNEFENRMADLFEKVLAQKPPLTLEQMATVNSGQGSASAVAGNSYVPPAAPETPAEAAVRKASANQIPMNPEWEERAREIIGDALAHCEIQYLRSGGVIFTVVIKDEFSNESADYIKYYGSDRRSKEIGAEGVEGVDNWCKLVKSNLARPKPLSNRN